MTNELEEGQIVLCTVEKIIGTTVFVKIQGNGEGTITTSEISPGRIRNLRNYVVPGKKIVCKILSTKGGIHLSLRRVKQNERKELLEKIKKEKSYEALLKTVLKEDSQKIIEKINEDYSIADFFMQVKQNPKILSKYVKKQDSEKILKILETKKEKPKQIKQIVKLSSKAPNGISKVKKIIKKACKGSQCDVSYIAAGKYSLGIIGDNFKKIKTELNKVSDNIEQQAKKENCEFSIEKIKH